MEGKEMSEKKDQEKTPVEHKHGQYDTETVDATVDDADFEAKETNRKDGSA